MSNVICQDCQRFLSANQIKLNANRCDYCDKLYVQFMEEVCQREFFNWTKQQEEEELNECKDECR